MICWVGLVLIRWRHDYELLLLRRGNGLRDGFMDGGAFAHCKIIDTRGSARVLLVHVLGLITGSDDILDHKRAILVVL